MNVSAEPVPAAAEVPASTASTAFARPLPAVDAGSVDCAAPGSPEGTWRITAEKSVSVHDPYMAAHFPGFTIYPAIFIIESVRQALAAAPGLPLGDHPQLRELTSVRLLAPLLDGDRARFEITLGAPQGLPGAREARADVRCVRRDGKTAATVRAVYREGGGGAA